MKKIQSNGHKIVVVTNATYSYENVKALFNHCGIKLSAKDYHKYHVKGRNGKTKSAYISSLKLNQKCLLVDDLRENDSPSVHYLQPTYARFPRLFLPVR